MLTPDQATQQAQSQLGVQGAQQQVQGLQGAINQTTSLLNQVAPGVMGRTQNSLVTSAQANQQIQNEQAPIQRNLDKDTQDFNQANTNYQDLEQQAESKANANLTGQQNQLSYLDDLYKTLLGGEQNQASLAEQAREFNATPHGSSSGGLSLGGLGGLLGGGTPSTGGIAKNSVGGYSVTNAQGQPITMAQYLSSQGYSTASSIAQAAAQYLAQGTTSDKSIAAAINSGKYTPSQLAKLYPQVFGGSF